MTSEQMVERLSPRRITRHTTIKGTEIVPLTPAQLDYRGDECYRRCQVLPASPQRFEWVNVKNIREVT